MRTGDPLPTMHARPPPTVPLAALLIVFAGCTGGAATGADTLGTGNGPVFDESTGSIRGAVRTEEIQPIEGAQVGVLGTAIVATTDAAGQYALNFVPPGKVTVSVVALGFATLQQQVDVVAGQSTERVDFTLLQLPSDGPFHTTTIFKLVLGGYELKLTPDCMYIQNPTGGGGSSTKTCQGGTFTCTGGPANSCNEVHYGHCAESGSPWASYGCDITNEWQTIVSEAQWTPGTALTGRGWSLETLAPNTTRSGCTASTPNCDSGSVDQSDKHDWWAETSKSPIHTRIDTDTFEQGSPTGTSHPVKPEDRCGGTPGHYAPGRCDWVWRIFMGWCTVSGLTGGAAGCEKTGPDFALDPNGTPVNIYFTYFMREPAPQAFTAIPDS